MSSAGLRALQKRASAKIIVIW